MRACVFFLSPIFHLFQLCAAEWAFRFLHYRFVILTSRFTCVHLHPTPFAVCPQHPSAVHRWSLKSTGQYLVRKLCSTEVSRGLLNSVSWSCCLHSKPEPQPAVLGWAGLYTKPQQNFISPLGWVMWTVRFIPVLTCERCRCLGSSVGHQCPHMQETTDLKQWHHTLKTLLPQC